MSSAFSGYTFSPPTRVIVRLGSCIYSSLQKAWPDSHQFPVTSFPSRTPCRGYSLLHLLRTQGGCLWGGPGCTVCVVLMGLGFPTNPYEARLGRGAGVLGNLRQICKALMGKICYHAKHACVKYIISLTQPHKSKGVSDKQKKKLKKNYRPIHSRKNKNKNRG